MAATDLHLFAAMIDQADISPILEGLIKPDHLTEDTKALYHFLTHYKELSGGLGRIPSRAVIENRFGGGIMLPETLGNEDIKGLVGEVRLESVRGVLRGIADKLQEVSGLVDPTPEIHIIRKKLDEALNTMVVDDDIGFDESIEGLLADYHSGEILPHGMSWPWPSLTLATRGMHRGEFYVISGRPKARKTFIALAVAAYAFLVHGARILFISPEMPTRQIMLRFSAMIAKLRYAHFKTNDLDPEEEERLFQAAVKYARKKQAFNPLLPHESVSDGGEGEFEYEYNGGVAEDRPPGTEATFRVVKGTGRGLGYVVQKIEQHRPDIVLVDSFYRLRGENSKTSDPDWKIITALSRGLKDVSMDSNVRMIVTHQLNRAAQAEVGDLSHLALSDSVGQDADLILRAITAERDGKERSALVVLGGRETAIGGVIINNMPCNDFSEIEPITDLDKQVTPLLRKEQKQEAVAENNVTQGFGKGKRGKKAVNPAKDLVKSAYKNEEDEGAQA